MTCRGGVVDGSRIALRQVVGVVGCARDYRTASVLVPKIGGRGTRKR